MCIICNGGTHDDVMFDLDSKLDRFGFTVTAVEGTKRKPGWAYTIGLADRFDHPELVVVGWHLDAWANAVHHFAARVRDGERFVEVDTVESPIGDLEFRLDEPAPLLARPSKPPATRRTNAPRGRKRR